MTTNNTTNRNILYGIHYGNHMIDSLTDTVFFSDLLPERCPTMYQSLDKILKENDIDHRLLSHTKDIWCRDYMPIQTSEKRFVFYKYNPDYLQTALNCISWNVATTQWNSGFMGEEYRVHGRPVSWIKKAAEKGYRNWQCNLGCCLFYGHGIEKDVVAANQWYEKSAEQGSAHAQFNLGLSYYKGEGVEKDYTKAMCWLKKASEQGDADAQLHIGRCLEETYASNEGIVAAYRTSAEMGNPEAMCFLGEWYQYGDKGLTIDIQESFSWWKKAAEIGYYQAQYKIGDCYDFGKGVAVDKKEALKWFKRSASKDYIPAVYVLGLCYYYGNGIRKNKREALKYFRRAAKNEYAAAVCMIGKYYYYGYIVDEDEEEAIKYFKRAAELGSERAAKILSKILLKSEEPRLDNLPF